MHTVPNKKVLELLYLQQKQIEQLQEELAEVKEQLRLALDRRVEAV